MLKVDLDTCSSDAWPRFLNGSVKLTTTSYKPTGTSIAAKERNNIFIKLCTVYRGFLSGLPLGSQKTINSSAKFQWGTDPNIPKGLVFN